METITFQIQKGDRLVEIVEGNYAGHLAVVKILATGEKALLVLDKSCKDFKSIVKVIDVLEYTEGAKCQPQNVH